MSHMYTLLISLQIPTDSPFTFAVSKQSLKLPSILCMFSSPACIPVKHIGTGSYGMLKFGKPKIILPIIPVSTTLAPIFQFPPKLNLDTGHITGSQTPNKILQSVSGIMYVHSVIMLFVLVAIFPAR